MRNWLFVLASIAVTGASASEVFTRSVIPVSDANLPALPWVQSYETFRIDKEQLTQFLGSTPLETPGFKKFSVISLPTPNGHLARFKIAESPILSNELAQRVQIKTYKIYGIDDKYASGRLDWSINGFHGIVTGPNGSYIIDPPKLGNRDSVVAYYRRDNWMPKNSFQCLTQDNGGAALGGRVGAFSSNGWGNIGALEAIGGDTLKTYRLAMNATGEYTAFYGGVTQAEAGITTSINRMNQVYDTDAAIRYNLMYIKAWPDGNTDPYTNEDGFTMLGENQAETDASVGDPNYDMGHVFSTGGGGVASINSVGVSGRKAQGVTGLPAPIGDDFDIDFVAHEMGHQWGGRHTFADCQGNGEAGHNFEPGSGTTIMAYAGICGADNVQPHSDPYFHVHNLQQITDWRNNAQSGGTAASNGNSIPTADAGADFTIPQSTPFKLTGVATDANNDPVTYCWEQYDQGTNAHYRSLNPSTSPTRFLPKLATVLAGGTDRWEPFMTADKTLTFRLSVRDNRPGGGGTAKDEMKLNIAGAAFTVTAPNGATSWNGGSQQTVTWNAGGGTAANVNIYLSADGGTSYGTGGATLLLANTPNDGSQQINVPQVSTTTGRIIVEAAGNIYYNVSQGNITITPTQVPVLTNLTLMNASVVGGFSTQGTVTIDFAGGGAQTVTTSSNNANATTTGSVTIPAGQLSANFAINTLPVQTDQSATISATLRTVTKTAILQITRDVGPEEIWVTPNVIGGGARAIGTVRLTRPAPLGGVVVSMTDNGPELAVNPNVIVASGYQQQNFTVITYAVNASVVRQITGTRAGLTATASVTIVPFQVAAFTIAPSGVVCGNDATGTVTLNAPAPEGGITVNLADNSEVINSPDTVTVPLGATSVSFPISTLTTSVQLQRQVTLTYKTQKMTRNLTVLTADIASLTVAPQTIKGGTSATATITLNGNAGSNFVVNCSASGPEVIVPSTVTVNYGQKTKTFTVNTTPVNNGRTRIITITRNGRTRTFAVVITK